MILRQKGRSEIASIRRSGPCFRARVRWCHGIIFGREFYCLQRWTKAFPDIPCSLEVITFVSSTIPEKSSELYIYLLTYLLTPYSRVLLEKLTGFAANQEIPRILWNNPKVHYCTHKRPHVYIHRGHRESVYVYMYYAQYTLTF